MASSKAAMFMKAATNSLLEEDGGENIINKIDKQDSAESKKAVKSTKKKPEEVNKPAEEEIEEKASTSSDSTTRIKPGKRRPQSVRKSEVGIKSMEKTDVPEEDKNLTVARTFSIDMETSERLDAAVKILQNSGAIVDKRPISSSAFVRIAVKRELDRLSKENGEAFDKAIQDEINRDDNTPVFKW